MRGGRGYGGAGACTADDGVRDGGRAPDGAGSSNRGTEAAATAGQGMHGGRGYGGAGACTEAAATAGQGMHGGRGYGGAGACTADDGERDGGRAPDGAEPSDDKAQ